MNEVAEKIEEQDTQQDLDFGEDKPVETKQQEETSFEVEIVDDRPEEDRVPKRKEDTQSKVEGDEDEAKNYSDKVQKRIKELKYEYHEERRAKEEASRLQEEALNYAKKLQKENEELRKSLSDGESVLINQAKGRVDAQLEKAKIDYKEAYESGDPDKLADASAELARIQNEKYRVDTYTPPKQSEPRVEQPKPMLQQPQKPKVSQRALEWANENTWFNKDSRMTSYAFGVHEELVKKGVVGDSEEYYKEIDREMRKVFPDKFDDVIEDEEAQQSQTGNVVAPTKRSAKKPRTVRLTSTQVNLARRLGLTKEQYAAQLMKDQGNG
jgi:hypothetical protein